MKAMPVRVFSIDSSRNVLKAWANGASADPEVAVDIGHAVGRVGIEVVMLVVLALVEVIAVLPVLLVVVTA
jgi:hypothetical protein